MRDPEVAIVDQEKCMNCWDCVTVCPFLAISQRRAEGPQRQFPQVGGGRG